MADKFLDYSGLSRFLDKVKDLIATKMDKNNPSGTGSFSMNRLSGSTVGTKSHTEGDMGTASGECSHVEGYYSEASGDYSHAEGMGCTSSGIGSHAEGGVRQTGPTTYHACGNVASGNNAHAEGVGTIASSANQHVSGRYNIKDNQDTYAEIVGNGFWLTTEPEPTRSNARTVDWSGNETLAGDLTINKGTASEMTVGVALASKANASDLPSDSGYKDNFTDVSLASSTNWSTLASFNLTKGVWLVEIAAEFQNNSTNFRGIGLYVGTSTPSSPSGIRYSNTIRAVDGAVTNMTMCMPIDINSDRTIYILGRQNSGITLTTKPRACWVKIMPR